MQQIWQLDLSLFRAIHLGWHHALLDPFFLVLSYTGLGQIQVASILLLSWRNRSVRPFWPYLLAVFALSGILNSALKRLFERERPSLLEWAVPQEPFRYSSFPSGHTVTSFALAFFALLTLRRLAPNKQWVGWSMVLWAVLVGLSRVYRGVHWPTDVLGAAGLGLCIASLCAWYCERRNVR